MDINEVIRLFIPYFDSHPRKSYDQTLYRTAREVARRQFARNWEPCLMEILHHVYHSTP